MRGRSHAGCKRELIFKWWRILKVADDEVECVAKDTKQGVLATASCTLGQFVQLLAAHVPDHYRTRFAILEFWLPALGGKSMLRWFSYWDRNVDPVRNG